MTEYTFEYGRLPGCHNLFVFGCDEHSGNTNELELHETDNSLGKETVDNVNCYPESFGKKTVTEMDLKKPVDESLTHLPSNLALSINIIRSRHGLFFQFTHVRENLIGILGDHGWIKVINLVNEVFADLLDFCTGSS